MGIGAMVARGTGSGAEEEVAITVVMEATEATEAMVGGGTMKIGQVDRYSWGEGVSMSTTEHRH